MASSLQRLVLDREFRQKKRKKTDYCGGHLDFEIQEGKKKVVAVKGREAGVKYEEHSVGFSTDVSHGRGEEIQIAHDEGDEDS